MLSVLRRVVAVFALAGSAIALGTGVLVVTSVTLRALITRPIPGDVELTQFGVALAISLALPWCQLHGSNIIVDFFTQKLRARVNRLQGFRRSRPIAQRHHHIADEGLMADASYRAALEALLELRARPGGKFSEPWCIEPVPHAEVRMRRAARELVPRTHRKAVIAAKHAVSQRLAERARNLPLMLDGEVCEAAARIELIGGGKRVCGADIEAGAA